MSLPSVNNQNWNLYLYNSSVMSQLLFRGSHFPCLWEVWWWSEQVCSSLPTLGRNLAFIWGQECSLEDPQCVCFPSPHSTVINWLRVGQSCAQPWLEHVEATRASCRMWGMFSSQWQSQLCQRYLTLALGNCSDSLPAFVCGQVCVASPRYLWVSQHPANSSWFNWKDRGPVRLIQHD